MNIQGWYPLGLTGLIFLQSKGILKSDLPTPQFKSITSLALSMLYSPTLTSTHDYWKTIALTKWTFVSKVMSLLLICCLGWCFWTVVLEKTLESPLDCKIKPVNPKENQSWIFIGRTDAKAEAPILWPPDVKNWLIWKDPDAGKDWRREEKGKDRG